MWIMQWYGYYEWSLITKLWKLCAWAGRRTGEVRIIAPACGESKCATGELSLFLKQILCVLT
jgi:hypothetical protein